MKQDKQDKREPEQHLTYKFGDTVCIVEAVFKVEGERILIQSIMKMADKGIKES